MKNKHAECMLCGDVGGGGGSGGCCLFRLFFVQLSFVSFDWATAEVVFQLYGLLTHIGRMFKHIRFTYMAPESIYLHRQTLKSTLQFHWKSMRAQ